MSRVQGKSGAYASSANNTNASISRLWPEPSPNWLEAIKEWKWLWQVHIYGFGSLFLVMALYVGFSLIRDRKKALMGHRTHFTAMDIMLQITGLVRSVILYWDPYLSSEVTSDARTLLFIVSWGVASACITSAFTIMLLIFLETTKTSLGPPTEKPTFSVGNHFCQYLVFAHFGFGGLVSPFREAHDLYLSCYVCCLGSDRICWLRRGRLSHETQPDVCASHCPA